MKRADLIFLDVETTGNEAGDRLCQLAWKKAGQPVKEMFSALYKPPVPIGIESMAVHHITEKMVKDKPLFRESEEYRQVKRMLEAEQAILVAHNAPFDVGMMQKEEIFPVHVIDTLKLIRNFDPEMKIKRHSLQYLRYFLKMDDDISVPIQAHDARSDVIVLELLFNRLYSKAEQEFNTTDEEAVIQGMIELSAKPVFIGKFVFGKYIGQKVEDVVGIDPGYLQWLLQQKLQSDQDESDWIYTLKKVLDIQT